MARWQGYRPFRVWLEGELTARDWRPIDLARRLNPEAPANVASSISKWMSGKRQPDTVSCAAIADVLGVDLDMVLSLAEHKPASASVGDPLIDSIAASLRALPRAQVEMISTSVRALHDQIVRHRSDAPSVDGDGSGQVAAPAKARKPRAKVDAAMAALPAGLLASLHSYAAAGMPGSRRMAAGFLIMLTAVVGG